MAKYHGIAAEIVSTIPMYTGRDLVHLRERTELGVQDIADLLEISRSTLHRIEKEGRELSPAACLLVQYLSDYAA